MRKIILLFIAMLFCVTIVQASTLTTKVELEISSISGITQLDNSDGSSVSVSIINSTGGVIVTRNAAAGIYKTNMSIVMIGAKFNLNYSTNYTYRLITIYGNFSYNFTTPTDPVPAVYNFSISIVEDTGLGPPYSPVSGAEVNCSGYSYYAGYTATSGNLSFNVNASNYLCVFYKTSDDPYSYVYNGVFNSTIPVNSQTNYSVLLTRITMGSPP